MEIRARDERADLIAVLTWLRPDRGNKFSYSDRAGRKAVRRAENAVL